MIVLYAQTWLSGQRLLFNRKWHSYHWLGAYCFATCFGLFLFDFLPGVSKLIFGLLLWGLKRLGKPNLWGLRSDSWKFLGHVCTYHCHWFPWLLLECGVRCYWKMDFISHAQSPYLYMIVRLFPPLCSVCNISCQQGSPWILTCFMFTLEQSLLPPL